MKYLFFLILGIYVFTNSSFSIKCKNNPFLIEKDSLPPILESFVGKVFNCEKGYGFGGYIQPYQSYMYFDIWRTRKLAPVYSFNGKKYFEFSLSYSSVNTDSAGNIDLSSTSHSQFDLGFIRSEKDKLYLYIADSSDNYHYFLDTLFRCTHPNGLNEDHEFLLFDFQDTVGTTRQMYYTFPFYMSYIKLIDKEAQFHKNYNDTVFSYTFEPISSPSHSDFLQLIKISRKRGIIEIVKTNDNVWGDRCRCIREE